MTNTNESDALNPTPRRKHTKGAITPAQRRAMILEERLICDEVASALNAALSGKPLPSPRVPSRRRPGDYTHPLPTAFRDEQHLRQYIDAVVDQVRGGDIVYVADDFSQATTIDEPMSDVMAATRTALQGHPYLQRVAVVYEAINPYMQQRHFVVCPKGAESFSQLKPI